MCFSRSSLIVIFPDDKTDLIVSLSWLACDQIPFPFDLRVSWRDLTFDLSFSASRTLGPPMTDCFMGGLRTTLP